MRELLFYAAALIVTVILLWFVGSDGTSASACDGLEGEAFIKCYLSSNGDGPAADPAP